MKAIVVDLELTQVTGRTPQIIQIGAVLVNTKTQKIIDRFDMIVRPIDAADRVEGLGDIGGRIDTNVNTNGSQTITALTGITAAQVEDGVPTAEALEAWWNWVDKCACGYRVNDWGSGDLVILKKFSDLCGVAPTKRVKSLDIKRMCEPIRELVDPKAKIKGGLKNTLAVFGLEFYGRQHNAYDDALNTAQLWLYILSVIEKSFHITNQMGASKFALAKEFKDG